MALSDKCYHIEQTFDAVVVLRVPRRQSVPGYHRESKYLSNLGVLRLNTHQILC